MSHYKDNNKSPKENFSAVPLREEKIEVEKQSKVKEEIHIKKIKVQETKTIHVPVKREELVVKRKSLLKNSEGKEIWGKEEKTIIPLKEEKVEISIEPVHTENIVVHKNKKETTKIQKEKIKKEEVKVSRNPSSDLEE